MGAVRFTYNACVDLYSNYRLWDDKFHSKNGANLKTFRAKLVGNDSPLVLENPWLKKTPWDVRSEAVRDFFKAYKAQMAKIKKKTLKHFTMGFKSRYDHQQCLYVHRKHWNKINAVRSKGGVPNNQYSSVWGTSSIPTSPGDRVLDLESDARLILTRTGKFYLCTTNEFVENKELPPECAASLDPGINTFQTIYDANGKVVEFGVYPKTKIQQLCAKIDALQSQWSQPDVRHHRRYWLRRRAARVREKIENMRTDMHRKCAKYLCETYRHIIIPIFKVQEMVCRSGPRQRRLNSRGARNMLSLGHFKFRQRLLSKARQTRSKVWVVTEEYTSKTCGSCGERYNVTGKYYVCPSCGAEFDRDFNGARNIMIKHLSS